MDTTKTIDMVEELRLRCWARENYVTPARRDDSWHPIILEEMRIRDEELSLPLVTYDAPPALSVVFP